MADRLALASPPGALELGTATGLLLLAVQSPVTAGVPGYPQRSIPVPPKNWPQPKKRKRERVPVYDASPVVVQADSIEEIELVLLDLI